MQQDCFDQFRPQNLQAIIWRYMDFTKFISILDTSSLFFCRSDLLGDPFEGSIPCKNYENNNRLLTAMGRNDERRIEASQNREQMRKNVYINCWHMNEHESAAMWKVYIKSNDGIAIKSTVQCFYDSLSCNSPLTGINFFVVQYINYEEDSFPNREGFRYLHKRKSFEYEQELRAFLFDYEDNEKTGIPVKTLVDKLIETIYVAPDSPDWFKVLVENITKKYGVTKEVKRTSLDDKALF